MRAEQHEDKGAQRQHVVRDNEIFDALNIADGGNRDVRKHIEAKRARQAQQHEQNGGYGDSTAAPHAEFVHRPAYEILEHGDNRGKSREAHEHEEKRSPYIAQRHFREYGGKSNEHERGTRIGRDAIREACGENDEARKNGNDSVERRNRNGLARQAALAANVATEDFHCGNAERQREERLSHCGVDRLAKRRPLLSRRIASKQLAEIGNKVKRDALARSRQGNRANAQRNHDDKERGHHDFRNALDAFLQAQAAHEKTDEHNDDHPPDELRGVGQHARKRRSDRIGIGRGKLARSHFGNVREHPARNRRVKHEQHVAADLAPPRKPVETAIRFQNVIRKRTALLARAAHGKFHNHNGQTKNHEEDEVQQHECSAAVLADDIGKTPNIA